MQRCGSCKRILPTDKFQPSNRGRPGTWCRECFAAYHRGERVAKSHDPRGCIYCGKDYVPQQLKPNAAFCSRECKTKAKNAKTAERFLARKPMERTCPNCGKTFGPERRADARFCSIRCSEAAHALQRKLRTRAGGAKVGYIRAQICERDGWRCGICRRAVDPQLEHPHPMCASLDHVVPVAAGGTNEMANLRLAHLRCNVRRRDRGGNEQLALI